MSNTINTMLTTKIKTIPSYVDTLAFYEPESNKIAVISVSDYKKCNYKNHTVISKTSELKDCGLISLVNLKDFIRRNPASGIEDYIDAKHSAKVYEQCDLYLAAYIILYRYYKCFETLVDNNFITFIDTFIDNCMNSDSDHDSTITYFSYDIHKILKLRKTVFNMFKDYINDYNSYLFIYKNQTEYKYTDKEFRVIAKTLKVFSKSKREFRQRFINTFENLNNNNEAV